MNWYFKLRDGLLARGFKQSNIDPCLFIKYDIICLIYVNDTIFFEKNQKIIDNMISNFKRDFDLTDEGDVDAFLGVQFDYLEDGSVKISQTGLINQILEDTMAPSPQGRGALSFNQIFVETEGPPSRLE